MKNTLYLIDSKISTENIIHLNNIKTFLCCFYFALSFYEPYLNQIIGSVTKYYIFFLMLILILGYKKIKIEAHHILFICWLVLKMISILWTSNTEIPQLHFVSQVGMIALLLTLTVVTFDKKLIFNIIKTLWLSSASIGLLSLFFRHPYHGTVQTRQVLLLFGQEVDPNNQAAFLVVGIAISLYYLAYQEEKKLLSILILGINAFSLLQTGSRAGLITLVLLLLYVVFFNKKHTSQKVVVKKIFILAIAITVIYFITKYFLPKDIYMRLFEFDSYEGGSNRDLIWGNAWDLFTKDLNFIFGAGWGASYGYNGMYAAVHNTYMSILCDVGIIGMLFFLIPIISNVIVSIKNKLTLPVLILIAGLVPSFFIDAINKRFFWNAIIVAFMVIKSFKLNNNGGKSIEENIDN